MVSLRFPFSFSQPPNPKHNLPLHSSSSSTSRSIFSTSVAIAAAVAAAGGIAVAGFAISENAANKKHRFLENALHLLFPDHLSPSWASIGLAESPASTVKDTKTGLSFPSTIGDFRQLLGIGLRRKSVFGLKNIDVYAFGVYADNNDVKNLLADKYGRHSSSSEGKDNKELIADLMEGDICMTVRLQIVYGRLSIRSVRSAFEESVGNRLQKFGGSDDKKLLQKFTSQFKDEYKLPRGSAIDLSRDRGHVLRTTIDGKEVGSIQSKVLCQALLDLYIGEDPFDVQAKEDMKLKVANMVQQ